MTCPVCNLLLDPAAGTSHPNCAPWAESDENPDAITLKHELMEMILWAERQNPRGQQKMIGPSEMGSVCDRQIGYRLAEVPECNKETDPWPAIVGTALHSWLEEAISSWGRAHNSTNWRTETSVTIDNLVPGKTDLYNMARSMVIDHKGAGNEIMRQVRKDGAKPEHRVQVHLYGLGYQQLGHEVKKVAVVYYPRAGWLRDCYVWVDDFKPDVAYAALRRLGSISRQVLGFGALTDPVMWQQIPATPSNSCGLCPWYDPGRETNRGADNTGCPGR